MFKIFVLDPNNRTIKYVIPHGSWKEPLILAGSLATHTLYECLQATWRHAFSEILIYCNIYTLPSSP
jgi:hypothetical protein